MVRCGTGTVVRNIQKQKHGIYALGLSRCGQLSKEAVLIDFLFWH
jgi:hypothetical protein